MRVAIVGAGPSGLTAIKICLDYGLQPVCFERSDQIGGLWYYREKVIPGRSTVMKSTVINTSKEMTAYSDFPPRRDLPNFMHNTQLMNYLQEYADQFQLIKHVHFNTEVIKVKKSVDHAKNGHWMIETKNTITSEVELNDFEAVLLCSGHHCHPYMPNFKGLHTEFHGKVMHSMEYRRPDGFDDKRVLVVGMGNSACDIATEIKGFCVFSNLDGFLFLPLQVFLSTRRGAWTFTRTFHCGYPYDVLLLTRFSNFICRWFPTVASRYLEFSLNSRFDHVLYSLKPKHNVFQAHPTLSDDLHSRLSSQMVVIKPDVCEFGRNSVKFTDASEESDIDTVILCTGYQIAFPYVEENILSINNNEIALFKNMYCPQLNHPETLAVIGLVQPWGSILPISEMQCRLACHLLANKQKLPPRAIMEREVQEKQAENAQRYVRSQRHTIQVDYVPYLDEISQMIGTKPNLWKYWRTDPKLAFHILFGPCLPYQYRLEGIHAWHGARDAILNVWDRIQYPTQTRQITASPFKYDITLIPSSVAVLLLIILTPIWIVLLVSLW
ncbi:Dimethylaniline monooxygenase [N-oxide-forming] 5 [Trichinella pseudospiralis]|uniref:Flavin-containing monooxygenase n=2 Tax=Trichinella pseudospiralis TaxID=6337 RepID=A0A0V1ISI2_TRIPS|nr:Dimethylaniline monooxygenase [N-oxide-forming] 5 [Trichinella pseudospiralis]KRZ25581.1 Dimethylaniline monooxygenase [N-oxide-forming] 5 [Trichinella pseudospiralis]KRZ39383.1 Dimethylaniline monooxygenase [N-oxide-forming] 5 [Trichinella pseudospiralis]